MISRRLGLIGPPRRELLLAVAAVCATAIIALPGVHEAGTIGLLTPLAVVLAVILISRPLLAISFALVLVVLCEGPAFGILTFGSNLYVLGFKDLTLVDGLVALAVLSVGLDVLRTQRPMVIPRALRVPAVLLALAMLAGVIVGHAAGASLRFAVASEHVMGYLLFVPFAVVNLDITRSRVRWLLGATFALAVFKAILGLVEVAGHLGSPIEGVATLTYYEPTANWLIMIAGLTVFAALLARAKLPLWMLASSPLLAACLLFSYRRSFWIGAVLGMLVLLILATTPVGRRMLVPTGLAILAAVWLLGSIHFQEQVPLVKRAASLSPSKLQANAEDRYRLNERANVWAEIERHPITGLGVTIPWAATTQTLSIEGEGTGRTYVHFASLYFWLKLGILGLFAYLGMILASMTLAWQAWRANEDPLLRAFALASIAGLVGMLAIETTATFTGVDPRFTLLLAVQIGVLALLARPSDPAYAPAEDEGPGELRLVAPMVPAMR